MYVTSQNFDKLVSNVEELVSRVDYKGICQALVDHAAQCGYTGREFNRGFNVNNVRRWCKAESSDGRLQYILAGLGRDSARGRLDVLKQWDYLCNNNIATQKALRSINPDTIEAGVMRSYPKKDSDLGTVEGRIAGVAVSRSELSGKKRDQAVTLTVSADNAKKANDRRSYSETVEMLAKLLEARKTNKKEPAVTKPEQTQGRSKGNAA